MVEEDVELVETVDEVDEELEVELIVELVLEDVVEIVVVVVVAAAAYSEINCGSPSTHSGSFGNAVSS